MKKKNLTKKYYQSKNYRLASDNKKLENENQNLKNVIQEQNRAFDILEQLLKNKDYDTLEKIIYNIKH